MITSEHSISIQASPEKTFSVLSNVDNFPRWVSVVKHVQRHTATFGVGATFTETVELLGQTTDIDKVVTAYEPEQLFAVQSTSGPAPHSIALHLTPEGNATTVRFVLQAKSPEIRSALASMVMGMLKSMINGDLRRLKRLVEQS